MCCVWPLAHFTPREGAAVFSWNLVRRGNTPACSFRSTAGIRLDLYLLVREDRASALVGERPLHWYADKRRLGLVELRHGSRMGLLAGGGLEARPVAKGRGFLLRKRLKCGAGYRGGAEGQRADPAAAVGVRGGSPRGARRDGGEHLYGSLDVADWILSDVCVEDGEKELNHDQVINTTW